MQLVVLAVPIAASVGCAALVSAALPPAHHLGTTLGWWALVLLCSTVTLFAVDRFARRLLPLALLLRLSLVFPDQAPRRFRLAARTWNTRRVREELARETDAELSTVTNDAATYVISLLASLAAHDRRTRGHCERVRAYNDLLAEELGLSEADRDRLRWAALIHDIGKLRVSRRVLNKPGEPTAREWDELRTHPTRGAEIAAPLAEWLGPWALAISQHHEHWDGTGYPHGLAGADISLGARIVGVADAFEVMTSPRPYHRPMNAAAARQELASCAGTHFDPQVVRALFNISLGRLRKATGAVALFAQIPLLASMPSVSAALIQAAPQAAIAAAGTAGVVAVASTSAARTHSRVPDVADPRPTTVPRSIDTADPLAGLFALTGHQRSSTTPVATPPTHQPAHGKAQAHRHRAVGRHGHSSARAHRHARTSSSTATARSGAPGQHVAATRRHHGRAHTRARTGTSQKNAATPRRTSSPANGSTSTGRCAGNNGSGVGNGGGSTSNTNSHNTQPGATLPPGLTRCG